METRHPVGGPFGRELSAFVIIVELWWPEDLEILWAFFAFCLEKKIPLKLSLLRRSRPKSARASHLHLAHTVPDFIQIGLLSAELLPNAWRPFLPPRVFTI